MTDDDYRSLLMEYRDFLITHSPGGPEEDIPFLVRLLLAIGALVLVAAAFYFTMEM